MVGAVIAGLGSAVPTEVSQEEAWEGFFAEHYRGNRLAERLWKRAGVTTRHGVALPWKEDLREWGTAARIERFVEEAVPLGREALSACLDEAGLSPREVGTLTVASCTGYATPGLDILLARELGLAEDTQRLHVGHMGCYAAIPALATLADAAVARKRADSSCASSCAASTSRTTTTRSIRSSLTPCSPTPQRPSRSAREGPGSSSWMWLPTRTSKTRPS